MKDIGFAVEAFEHEFSEFVADVVVVVIGDGAVGIDTEPVFEKGFDVFTYGGGERAHIVWVFGVAEGCF